MMECCGTCKYNQVDKDIIEQRVFICMNELSEYYGDYTEYSTCCDDYEEKEQDDD